MATSLADREMLPVRRRERNLILRLRELERIGINSAKVLLFENEWQITDKCDTRVEHLGTGPLPAPLAAAPGHV